jgi:GNAT superfamily N-acetyltransferase
MKPGSGGRGRRGASVAKSEAVRAKAGQSVRVCPATPDRWEDLERLFGPRGACAGCWCMWWRRQARGWTAGKGEGNRRAFRKLVLDGEKPGLIAYVNGEAAGWIAVAPRERYPRLLRARTLKPVDETPVWSVTCFFTAAPFRRQGITVRLLEAAAEFARKRGATMLEGYPTDPGKEMPGVWVYTGIADARPSAMRRIMRRKL